MKIDFANLKLHYQTYKDKIDSNIQVILNKSNYILGEEVQNRNILQLKLKTVVFPHQFFILSHFIFKSVLNT